MTELQCQFCGRAMVYTGDTAISPDDGPNGAKMAAVLECEHCGNVEYVAWFPDDMPDDEPPTFATQEEYDEFYGLRGEEPEPSDTGFDGDDEMYPGEFSAWRH